MATEFDERLMARLVAFQQANGITATGTADATTWQVLTQATPAAGTGQLSPDGLYQWDGTQWLPVGGGTLATGDATAVGAAGGATVGAAAAGATDTPHALTPPLGGAGPAPAGLPPSETLDGFGTNSHELTPAHEKALQRVADDLAAQPLGPGGFVTLTGSADRRGTTADNHALGQRRADAALKYLLELVTDDAIKQEIRAYSIGEPDEGPEQDDPSLRKVEVTIHRREHRVELKRTPPDPIRRDKPIDSTPEILKPGMRVKTPREPDPDPRHPTWPDWFWHLIVTKPVPPSFISELSAFLNKAFTTHDIATLVAKIAGRFGLSATDQARLRNFLDEKFQEAGEEGIKKALGELIEGMAGAPTNAPHSQYGPAVDLKPLDPQGQGELRF